MPEVLGRGRPKPPCALGTLSTSLGMEPSVVPSLESSRDYWRLIAFAVAESLYGRGLAVRAWTRLARQLLRIAQIGVR